MVTDSVNCFPYAFTDNTFHSLSCFIVSFHVKEIILAHMKHCRIAVYVNAIHTIVNDTNCCWVLVIPEMVVESYDFVKDSLGQ